MTGFTGRKNHGKGHSYWLDGEKVDGVTTVINKGLPKPALVDWAARSVAGYAVDHWDELSQEAVSARMKVLEKSHYAIRDSAAVRGTRVHALADKLANGEQVGVPDELAGHVEACVKFLDDFDVQPVLTEASVFSRQWKYAGTLDLIATIDGRTWLLDWKTNKTGAFGDTAFQLAAYRYAEFTLDPLMSVDTGNRLEVPVPAVDECGVVWLRADGYDLYPYHADKGVWREFLYIQQCARAAGNSRDYKGDALIPPVRTPQ